MGEHKAIAVDFLPGRSVEAVQRKSHNEKGGWSRRRDSNPWPAVYETAALPAELRRRFIGNIA